MWQSSISRTQTALLSGWRLPPVNLMRSMQYILLIGLLLLSSFVLLMTLSISLRPRIAVMADFWGLPIPPIWWNYQWAWALLSDAVARTTLLLAVSIAGIIIFALPAAYALARIPFPGKRLILLGILAMMMVPGPILLTPNYILAMRLDLLHTEHGLVLFYIGGNQAFAIFLITVFFRNQEREMFEAARVDGASELQALIRIAVPLAWPIIMTVVIMNFLTLYSDLIFPALMLPQSKPTVMVLLSKFSPENGAAAYIIGALPQLVVFVVAMRYFVQGLTSGAIKA